MTAVQLNMTEPQETQMTVSVLAALGGIPKIFSATMEFTDKVEVSWEGWLIGSVTLETVHVSKGKEEILHSAMFQILNTTALSQFAKVMIKEGGVKTRQLVSLALSPVTVTVASTRVVPAAAVREEATLSLGSGEVMTTPSVEEGALLAVDVDAADKDCEEDYGGEAAQD
ncbi:hypothetical protein KI688_003798 [Linnemannia hyalina]|uniref:Uncharacterized protein n=1 Tax=Linnemannia hyalina TaxID=64524 RepID=A0A9P8BS92_9FUNG|nr:hypothetical protein KI688_003798 [Linnemannia hyalina]